MLVSIADFVFILKTSGWGRHMTENRPETLVTIQTSTSDILP
jgi:hypothetical protein